MSSRIKGTFALTGGIGRDRERPPSALVVRTGRDDLVILELELELDPGVGVAGRGDRILRDGAAARAH
jgi:hypothetical protein